MSVRQPYPVSSSVGPINFIQLADVPSSYTGQSGKVAAVKSTEDGLEFIAVGGTGTVTSVSVTTANGVSGSVATATTTPAITLTLGAISPTTVNKVTLTAPATGSTLTIDDGFTLHATGNVTALSGSHTGASSGTNTGDQTNITGNAATVTTNANLTGPITSVGNATSIASQTGTGNKFVVDTSPTLVTPVLGVATATSINKVAVTAPATSSTLTIADGKTLTCSNNADVAGTNTGDQLTFKTIAVSGQSDIVADTITDTLTIVAGTNITLTTDATTDTLTIAASGGGGSPAGNNTNIQFNDSSAFGGSDDLTWTAGSQTLTIKNGANSVYSVGPGSESLKNSSGFTLFDVSQSGGLSLKNGSSFNLFDVSASSGLQLQNGSSFQLFVVNTSGLSFYDGSSFSNFTVSPGALSLYDAGTNRFIIGNGTLKLYESGTQTIDISSGGVFQTNSLKTGSTAPTTSGSTANVISDSNGQLSFTQNGSIVASGDLTAQTATVSSVTTVTSPNDGNAHTYLVGAYSIVTAISAGTVTVTCTYTDQNNAARTATFFGEGLTTAAISGTGATGFPPITIRTKANTAITLVATFAGVSITYDVGGFIQQIN